MSGEAYGPSRERSAPAATAASSDRDARRSRRDAERCDACGEAMQPMGHCKWLCRCCGFLRTCIDTI
jgi:hypothetical protein